MLSSSLMTKMTGTMMAVTMAMAGMPRAMGFTNPQPLVSRPLQPFRSGCILSVSSSPFLAQLRHGQCQHHHDGLHQRWYPSVHMTVLSSEADDSSGSTPLSVSRYDSVFKNNDFWTIKDDDERIMKMLKTLPKPDESVIMQSMKITDKAELTDEKMNTWEVEWLNRMMRFRKKIIDMVENDGVSASDVQIIGWAFASSEEDNLLAQWLYNADNNQDSAT